MSLSKLAAIVTLLLAGTTASVLSYVESRAEAAQPSRATVRARTAPDEAGAPAVRAAPASRVEEAACAPAASCDLEAGPELGPAEPLELGAARAAAPAESRFEHELEGRPEGDPSRWQRVRRSDRAGCSPSWSRLRETSGGCEPGPAAREAAPAAPAPAPAAGRPTMSGPV